MHNISQTYTIESLSKLIGIASSCIEADVPLKQRTWIHRGGIARWWLTPRSYDELLQIGQFLMREKLEYDIIGHTSNIYFKNTYNPIFVIDTKYVKTIEYREKEIICDAGVPIAQLARQNISYGIQGYEGLLDLPGTVAAGVVNNSGCFGCEMSKIVKKIELLTEDNRIIELQNSDLHFIHRNSALKLGVVKGIILRVYLDASTKGDSQELKTIGQKNHSVRIEYQEKPAHNLGSMFSSFDLKKDFRYFMIRSILKCLAIANVALSKRMIIQKHLFLTLYNKKHLLPYISNKNLNTYLFLDAKADRYFKDYVNFVETICKDAKLEIEVRE